MEDCYDMEERRKKHGITIKIPIEKLETEDTYDRVKVHLKRNSKEAYTRIGLMVEIYGYKPEDLNAPFRDWPDGTPNQYRKIVSALEELKNEGLINSKKQGKKFLYWWKGS